MGLISNAEKNATAIQIKQWYDSAISNINSVKEFKSSLSAQLEAMKVNNEYTADDIAEVKALIDDIKTQSDSI